MKKHIAILLLTTSIIGCQSTSSDSSGNSKSLCNNDSWKEFGKKIALSGKSVRTFNTYKDKCGEQLPVTAKETYLAGFREGLVEFCTYENGYNIGGKGKDDTKLCPLELRKQFELGYKKGQKDLQDNKDEARRLADQEEQRKMAARPNPLKG
jgi:hypothetical protein